MSQVSQRIEGYRPEGVHTLSFTHHMEASGWHGPMEDYFALQTGGAIHVHVKSECICRGPPVDLTVLMDWLGDLRLLPIYLAITAPWMLLHVTPIL